MFSFNCKAGTVDCKAGSFRNGKLLFVVAGRTVSSDSLSWKGGDKKAVATESGIVFSVSCGRNGFEAEVKNSSAAPIRLDSIRLAFEAADTARPLPAGNHLEFVHSLCCGDMPGVKKVGLVGHWLENNPESSMLYLLFDRESESSVLFSVVPPHRGAYTSFRALHDSKHMEGNIGLEAKFDFRCEIAPRASVQTNTIICRESSSPLPMLREAGEQWKRKNLKPAPIGWNSWDYYAASVSSDDVYSNQKAAKKHFGKKLSLFAIDDGHQTYWGDWRPNAKFPEGFKSFCAKVKKEGGVPGIWCAPVMVNTMTRFYRDNPELFGRDENGQVVVRQYSNGSCALLDPTHPKAKKWITELYQDFVKCGFKYFKVDFTNDLLHCAQFHDRSVPRGAIIRTVFETVRKAIGPQAYLTSCGAPFESVTGLVDSVRITGDIHNHWGHVVCNAQHVAAHWWMSRNLWNNDPDFLIVRAPETTADKQLNRLKSEYPSRAGFPGYWLAGREMNLEEAKTLALMIYITGGDLILSDDLAKLNRTGIDILSRVLENPLTQGAVPIDMFDSHDTTPSLWLAKEKDRWFVGMFNWGEDQVEATVDLNALGLDDAGKITSFWTGKKLAHEDGLVSVSLPPRHCEGLVIQRK